MTMNRMRVTWSGLGVGPGLSTFYFGDTTTDMGALKTFLTQMCFYLPNSATFTIGGGGDKINETDGKIVGTWVATNGGTSTGSGGTGTYSGVSGFCVNWLSSLIVNGSRVQGRTFFVPASSNLYENNGTIVNGTLTTLQGQAQSMIVAYAGEFRVFSRPFAGKAADPGPPIKPAIPPRVGASAQVITARIPDIAVILRSRRD